MLNTNYKKTIATIKVIARDNLRMGLIARRTTRISNMNLEKTTLVKGLEAYTKRAEEITKDIARNDYAFSKIEDANPDATELRKTLTDSTKLLNEMLAENTKDAAQAKIDVDQSCKNLDEAIKEQNDKIALIEKGETKVSLDELNTLTNELLLKVAKETANSAVSKLATTDVVAE